MRVTHSKMNIRPGLWLASVLLALLSMASLHGGAFAADDLSAAEQRLYSHSYEGEPLDQRLARLEASVFGESQSGAPTERQARLLKVLGAAQKVVPHADQSSETDAASTEPSGDKPGNAPAGISRFTPPGSTPQSMSTPTAQPAVQQPPDATDYPTVTALERQVFGRDFIRDDVRHRLGRLEKKVFGQSYDQSALVDRVDRLLARYPGVNSHADPTPGDSVPGSALNNLPSDSSQFAGSGRDVYTKVDALEKSLLNGKANPNSLLTERLDRLEAKVYGHTFSGESIDTRVSRLMRSYEVNTGTQPRPGFQARQPYQHPVGAPQVITPSGTSTSTAQTTRTPQNIQIGAGLSQNSSHQFSPEMMSMLPPEVRQQMSGSGTRSNGSVVSAPSTVVIEQTTTAPYPGFQTYGGQPIQQYNYYGIPTTQTQSQTTTTVIQPNGSASVYSYPTNTAYPGNPNGLPNPAYVGDPAFLQSLGNLEIHVFGQVNTVEPVYIRLGKLESAVLGQMYVGYPEAQRLTNLEKAYQLQAVSKLLGQTKGANMGRAAGSAVLGIPLNTPSPMSVPPIPMNMGIPAR
jgi:hypothetical protein